MAVLPTPASPINTGCFVFGASAKNLNYAFDLVLATDDRIQLTLLRQLGQIAAEPRGKAGVLTSLLLPSCRDSASLSGGAKFGSNSPKISFRHSCGINFQTLEYPCGDSLTFPQESQQNVFGTYVRMIVTLGPLCPLRPKPF